MTIPTQTGNTAGSPPYSTAETFLGRLDAASREHLLGLGRLQHYPARAIVFFDGDDAHDVLVVRSGEVKVSNTVDGREVLIDMPGATISLASSRPSTADPVVVEQVAAHTGRPLLFDADPKLVVALGAALDPIARHATQEAPMATTPTTPGTPPPPPGSPGAAGKDAADAKGGTVKPPPPPGSPEARRERRTQPGSRPPEKSGLSTAGKVAAGVATAAGVTAAATVWRDDLADAIGLGDDEAEDTAEALVPPEPRCRRTT